MEELSTKKKQELELLIRNIKYNGYTKKIAYFSVRDYRRLMKKYGVYDTLTPIRYGAGRRRTLKGLHKAVQTYIKVLLNKIIEYNADGYIPYLGSIRIIEYIKRGKIRGIVDGKFSFEVHTVFDNDIGYRLSFEHTLPKDVAKDPLAHIRLSKAFSRKVLNKIYKRNYPKGKFKSNEQS